MSNYQVQEEKKHSYYTEIPHIVRKLGLKPSEFRVYVELKAIAGEKDKDCFAKTSTLAKACCMSKPTFIKVRQKLQMPLPQLGNKPLIKVQERFNDTHLITITDIWEENDLYYKNQKEEKKGVKKFYPRGKEILPKREPLEEESKETIVRECGNVHSHEPYPPIVNSSLSQEKEDIREREKDLLTFIVSEGLDIKIQTIRTWIKKWSNDHIKAQIHNLKKQKKLIRNQEGWLEVALKNNYAFESPQIRENRRFAQQILDSGTTGLIIKNKYCIHEHSGKDFYFSLPVDRFKYCLKSLINKE